MTVNKEKIALAVKDILEAVGEDPNRLGLLDTPMRVARMYEEIFSGLEKDPKKHLETVFEEEYSEMVLVKDIGFHSVCEHHLVPFYGKVSIAYLPADGNVVGLSKLARIVEDISKRPQVQERITKTIADLIETELKAVGVFVYVEAEHMCMAMRGVKKPGAVTITTAARGLYANDADARIEILTMIK